MSSHDASARLEESWESVYAYRQHLDELLEDHQGSGRDLTESLEGLLQVLARDLGADGAALRLASDPQDRFAVDTVYRCGDAEVEPQDIAGWNGRGKKRHFTAHLDVGAEVLGTLTVAFTGDDEMDETWAARFVDAFAEQVDNLVFQVRQQAREHRLSVHIQLCLETPVMEDGLDEAVRLIGDRLPFHRILFLYKNTHTLYPERVAYRLYDEHGAVDADSIDRPSPELEGLFGGRRVADIEPEEMPEAWSKDGDPPRQLSLIHAGRKQEVMGKFFFWLEPGANVRSARRVVEILRSAVIQRLADYSKDARELEKYFPQDVVYRLLREESYQDLFLAPRLENIGVIFVDVAGFTRLSESALKNPEDTGRFIDLWSEGTTRILMQHGGVMDKLIGDCLLGLFGPPFFHRGPAKLAAAVGKAAIAIRAFTRELIDDPRLADLKPALEAAGGLDVSTGIHIGPASVGIFGPNKDYTAFGSVMNNTARIQGHAKPGQTLAHEDVVLALGEGYADGFRFGEAGEFVAKNVAEPLKYRVVEAVGA